MSQHPEAQLSLFGTPAIAADPDVAERHEEQIAERLGSARGGPLDGTEMGDLHQAWLEEEGTRKATGSYYTPPDVVERLLELALEPLIDERAPEGPGAVASLRVIDPACGSGNFLVAAARRISAKLVALGVPTNEANRCAFGQCVIGIDIDEHAVDICRLALQRGSSGAIGPAEAERQVLSADALIMPNESPSVLFADLESDQLSWTVVRDQVDAPNDFDLVIGNPPFLSQLSSETASDSDYASQLRARFGLAATGFVDPAALFLLLGVELGRTPGGVVCLIEPTSILSTRDAGSVRNAVLEAGRLGSLWVAEDRIFDAAVDVCAVRVLLGKGAGSTELLRGRAFQPVGRTQEPTTNDRSWAHLLASIKGLPKRDLAVQGTLADIAQATADFRDQYYGLAPHVIEQASADDSASPRLVTAGLIDPATLLWGQRSTKFNKTKYLHPRVPLDGLDGKLRTWARQRLVPKILLATQTKVLETVVDEEGTLLPSVPVITVTTNSENLWRVAALLSSPPVTLVAANRHFGAALSADALKLSARDVLDLPCPAHDAAWTSAATLFEAASRAPTNAARRLRLIECASMMCEAYGLYDDTELLDWWKGRLPAGRADS